MNIVKSRFETLCVKNRGKLGLGLPGNLRAQMEKSNINWMHLYLHRKPPKARKTTDSTTTSSNGDDDDDNDDDDNDDDDDDDDDTLDVSEHHTLPIYRASGERRQRQSLTLLFSRRDEAMKRRRK